MKEYRFIAEFEDEGERIDKFLTNSIDSLSRSFIQRSIEDGNLKVGGFVRKSNYRLRSDDEIIFLVPDSKILNVEAVDIPIDIVYEDDDVAIVNKPQGMVVHPSNGHYNDTLVNALLYHMDGRLSGINGVLRPGIVHRIDKDTSGLLIICKNDISHNSIAEQIKAHSVDRIYHGIVHGRLEPESGRVDAPIGRDPSNRLKMAVVPGGKPAVTNYRVLEYFRDYSYVEFKLETGRTHQIRVHMADLKHPLMGDPLYCGGKEPVKCEGQILHAKTIGFTSPSTGEHKVFDSQLPDYFNKILNYLRN
ncbi:MAG: RluA family pseudouridine synthase [Lachnospiraceae bacterium]|nr:RluA family pseudouridine synthase [Lachnospiraceae bacterium]